MQLLVKQPSRVDYWENSEPQASFVGNTAMDTRLLFGTRYLWPFSNGKLFAAVHCQGDEPTKIAAINQYFGRLLA